MSENENGNVSGVAISCAITGTAVLVFAMFMLTTVMHFVNAADAAPSGNYGGILAGVVLIWGIGLTLFATFAPFVLGIISVVKYVKKKRAGFNPRLTLALGLTGLIAAVLAFGLTVIAFSLFLSL